MHNPPQVCKFFLAGNCAYGNQCRFEHTAPRGQQRGSGGGRCGARARCGEARRIRPPAMPPAPCARFWGFKARPVHPIEIPRGQCLRAAPSAATLRHTSGSHAPAPTRWPLPALPRRQAAPCRRQRRRLPQMAERRGRVWADGELGGRPEGEPGPGGARQSTLPGTAPRRVRSVAAPVLPFAPHARPAPGPSSHRAHLGFCPLAFFLAPLQQDPNPNWEDYMDPDEMEAFAAEWQQQQQNGCGGRGGGGGPRGPEHGWHCAPAPLALSSATCFAPPSTHTTPPRPAPPRAAPPAPPQQRRLRRLWRRRRRPRRHPAVRGVRAGGQLPRRRRLPADPRRQVRGAPGAGGWGAGACGGRGGALRAAATGLGSNPVPGRPFGEEE
jgi:hypothetical protein